jgi:glycosyltransferase involved in cell wall biosynthesis
VIKEVPQARHTIVGDGEERDRLERLTKKLNVHEYVKFTGFIRFEELVKIYAESSVLVLPSITRLENFGIVLLEAIACRTPVIASKIPGVMDLVTNENGLLVEPKSVEGLAEAIISIIHDENKVIKMGKRAEDWWKRNIIGMSLALKSSTCIGS